jgi:hypothetical protein
VKRIIFALSLVCASSVLAQTSASTSVPERTTVITIGEETIEGDLKMPAGFVASARPPRSTHRTLVKPRIDFRRELLSSVASL